MCQIWFLLFLFLRGGTRVGAGPNSFFFRFFRPGAVSLTGVRSDLSFLSAEARGI